MQIGRGEGYAFSATSSGADNVDTVIERLCNPSGAPVTVDAVHYLRDGRCVPMQRFEHTETALPTPAAPGAPQRLRFLVLRTHHGIVQERTTVAGAPVAVVTQRSTYGREVDSALGFAQFNDPGFLTGPEAFGRERTSRNQPDTCRAPGEPSSRLWGLQPAKAATQAGTMLRHLEERQ